jgi:predicted DCC family thiol-disulfide oxidoreductase YuxK
MRELTVLWDATCPMCVRCRVWLGEQRAMVPLRFVPCGSDEARASYASIPWLGAELVVVSDDGDVWAGPAAFLVCLWTLEDWREWSYTLSGAALAPLVERFFQALSSHRQTIAAFFRPDACEGGTCKAPSSHALHPSAAAYR